MCKFSNCGVSKTLILAPSSVQGEDSEVTRLYIAASPKKYGTTEQGQQLYCYLNKITR